MDKTIVIQSAGHAAHASQIINLNWQAMHAAGQPMAVSIHEYKSIRSIEQQSLMWVRLGEIAEQAWVNGRQYAAETWHEHFKREYLPDEAGPTKRCRKGYKKWEYMPNGERVLVGSTTMLTVFGMSEYMTQIETYAATELGVMFK
jgi:hypothetical protein